MEIEAIIKEIFTQEDYDNIMQLESHRVKEFYQTKPVNDWICKVTHKPQRFKTERMIYIVQLNCANENNLVNDDMYWRAEPKKFFGGTPTIEEIWEALQVNYNYFKDEGEYVIKELNLTFDPEHPEFDS